MFKRFIVALTVALLLAGGVRAAEPLNFVILLVDDWGWRDAGFAGSDLYETPHMDRLAAEGTVFSNGYAACTVCSPTRAAVMTGKYPPRTGVTNYINTSTMKMRLSEVTIAEVLRGAGYATAHVGKWHLAPRNAPDTKDHYPEDQGFDVNIGGNHWGAPGSYFHPYESKTRHVGVLPPGGEEGDYLTERLTDEALRLLDSYGKKPFFLYFPYYAVHTPIMGREGVTEKYEAKITYKHRHRNAEYASMVQGVDESVGRLRTKLQQMGVADRTVIILTGDNGGLDRKNNLPTDNWPLRAGKGSTYEGGVRVPTVVLWPGVTRPGSVCDEPIISVDYYPTILEMAGLKGVKEHNATVDGVSLTPLLRNPKADLDRDAIYWHFPHNHGGGATPYGAIREGDWKLIRWYVEDRIELYNLKDDLSETKDLASMKVAKAASLRKKLDAWLKETGAIVPPPGQAKKKGRG
ncbi:MAG: sulfatase [Planctomycetota bacterium]|jgi:arylsulfatase A-like enzyme